MTENLNFIPPSARIKCPQHDNYLIKKICASINCQSCPYVCPDEMCKYNQKYSHNGHKDEVKKLNEFLVQFPMDLEENSKQIDLIQQKAFQGKENQNSIKQINNIGQHIRKMQDYVDAQKFAIDSSINEIIGTLQDKLYQARDGIYKRLDDYLLNYKNNLESFKQFYDQAFCINKKYKYYQNCNNLSSKLQVEIPQNSSQFLNEIKFALKISKLISSKSDQFVGQTKDVLKDLNQIFDQLPMFNGLSNIEVLEQQVTNIFKEYFESTIKIPEKKLIDFSFGKEFLIQDKSLKKTDGSSKFYLRA